MSTDPKETQKKVAQDAVGRALLFRASKNGGSYGGSITTGRARKEAENGFTGSELYDLLIDVATRASQEALDTTRMEKSMFKYDLERLAESTNSLALHRFIETRIVW